MILIHVEAAVEKINDKHQNIRKQWGQVTPIALG
jgi:hypothetical protein